MNVKFWEVVIPILCGAAISIILYIISKRKKIAIFLSLVVVSCSILFVFFLQKKSEKENVYSNEYISINYGDLECIDEANSKYPCNVQVHDRKNNSIHIFMTNISMEMYNGILGSKQFYLGMLDGYCAGYIGVDKETAREQIFKTGDKGVWIERTYVNYLNTCVYDGDANEENILTMLKVLYIGEGEMLVAVLKYEGIDYEFFCNSDSKNIVEFRECFDSIEQKVVQVPSDKFDQ